jgi:hypothetical protein
MPHDAIRTGQKCGKCAKDRWQTARGHLVCVDCKSALWLERWHNDGKGVRFRYVMGASPPPAYRGWHTETR